MTAEVADYPSNVVRFPAERRARPSLELLYDIAPSPSYVLMLAETFGLEPPDPEVRNVADWAMAEHILNHVDPQPGPARKAALRGLLKPVIETAVSACREADKAASAAVEAQQRAERARAEGGYWLAPLDERASLLTRRAASLMLQAHMRAEQARGAARAVRLALHGEEWRQYDPQAEAEALFFGSAAAIAG